LANDTAIQRPTLETRFLAAVVPGWLVTLALFAMTLGPRPDIMSAIGDVRFLFKLVVTLLLAVCAAVLVWRLARPGAPTRLRTIALAMVPIVLALGVTAELVAVPRPLWGTRMIGVNWAICLLSIPMFALPVLVAALIALRGGAPTQPALAGAVAGLFAGGIGGATYAAHCPDDSPLFVAAWYSLAIASVACLGALVGRFVLRW
jgi:hypothetical protein